MYLLASFFNRITTDFKQKELLPLKLLFFVHSSTLYVLYPYLTIHMRELGINVEETAIMSAVTPIVAIIMPPLAGLIADRIGNFKVILSLLSGLGGLAALMLLMVPVGRATVPYPKDILLEFACKQGEMELSIADGLECAARAERTREATLRLEACGMTCPLPLDSYAEGGGPDDELPKLATARTFSVQLKDDNDTENYRYELTGATLPSRVSELPGSRLFLPMAGLVEAECSPGEEINRCVVGRRRPPGPLLAAAPVPLPLPATLTRHGGLFRVISIKPAVGQPFGNASCSQDEFGEETVTIGSREKLGGCLVRCLATTPRANLCANTKVVREYDISLTFWLYLSVRVFIGMISGTAFAMFEGAVIAILREHKADYGLQRIYATIGGMISSPLSGWLIDYASEKAGYTDFKPAFYLYAALKIVSALLMLTINLEFKAPATDVVSDVLIVLRKTEVVALLATCFILGTAWGYIESFLFWLLQDLGASRSLMGITITVGGVAGLPLLVMSGPIIDKIGHANVLFIGFVFYAIRLMGYSLIYNAWMCLIFEAMESVTSSLAFTAAVTYAAKLSTMATDSSVQGLVGGLYYGVGKGAGSLAGGYLMEAVGTRATYQIFAGVTLLTGIVYFLFNKFYIVKRSEKESEPDEKPKDIKDLEKSEPKDVIGEPAHPKTGSRPEENGGCQVNRALEPDQPDKL